MRGGCVMSFSDYVGPINASQAIALGSAIVALFSLLVSTYAVKNARRVQTSGFKASESVKSDTARLVATLRSLMLKGVLYTQQERATRDKASEPHFIDLKAEKNAIQDFLTSSTALAYYGYAARSSESSRIQGKEGDEWRIFFLRLVGLLHICNPYAVAKEAAWIEKMIEPITGKDIEYMSAGLNDISATLTQIMQDRQHDPIFHVLVDLNREDDKKENDLALEFILHLELTGKDDNDLRLFAGVIRDDIDKVKAAAEAGAKVNITIGELLRRYKDEFQEFRMTRPDTGTR